MRQRDTNLDLLRAAAILLVVIDHVPQRWPTDHPDLLRWTNWGGIGVDLFFVLSGWLIGGLFWRENAQFGNVQLGRFWCRRALRTMPPYLVALALAFGGVAWSRHEPFDWHYFFFLQNYHRALPYFRVSWSLCIEEHFYLLMPLTCLLLWRWARRPEIWLPVLALAPALGRTLAWQPDCLDGFGFYQSATHLRCEGLILGVWASFVRSHRPALWTQWRGLAPYVLAGAVLALAAVEAVGSAHLEYAVRWLLLAAAGAALLTVLVERPPVLFSDTRPVFWVATTSYSVYLTHLPAIETSLRLMGRVPANAFLWVGMDLVFAAVLGAAFYWLIEVPSLSLRHRLMPARSHDRSPLRDAIAAG